jgi:hypothetical protein
MNVDGAFDPHALPTVAQGAPTWVDYLVPDPRTWTRVLPPTLYPFPLAEACLRRADCPCPALGAA